MIVHFPVHAILKSPQNASHRYLELIRRILTLTKSKSSNNESLKWSDKKLDVPLLEWKNETPFKLEIPNW